MKMLNKYMWTIWECCTGEQNDGDAQSGTIAHAEDFFIGGITGNPDCQYECLKEIDVAAARAEWEALTATDRVKELKEFDEFVEVHGAALNAAYGKGDRAAFMAIVNS